jgi:hypothetical protein
MKIHKIDGEYYYHVVEVNEKISALEIELEEFRNGFWGRMAAKLLIKNKALEAELERGE